MRKVRRISKNKFAIFIIILAVILAGVGIWYWQKNSYSKEILKLEILGPDEADLVEEVEYTVKYKNNGNIRLESARLTFEFPSYSIREEGKPLREEMVLEDIYPGQEKTFSLKARLLGKEGEIKEAKAWLSYQPKNLKARYESETSKAIRIKSVPLTLEFDLSSQVESGKDISFELNYFSNANYPLFNLGIKTEYPADFEFVSSKPSALEKTDWEIGLLNKAQGGRIQITGKLRGEVGEQQQFKAQLGSWQDGRFVLLKETIRAVEIVVPSLYISQQINNNPQYMASAGDTLHYEISFKNIGKDVLNNLFLVANLEGDLFDLATLKAPTGEFEVGDNSIIFDWRKIPKLQFLNVGDEGEVEFWVELKDDWQNTGSQSKDITLKNKVYLSQAQKEFTTKVNSKIVISQNGYFADEVFGNTGPTPPMAGQTTTYTVIWQAKNYYNDVKNAKVKAILGKGVSLTGKIFPQDAHLTFDSTSREVVWGVGDLAAGRGILDASPNIAFQIAFTPTASQQGATFTLVSKAKITAEDQFTGTVVEGESSTINTEGVGQ